MKQRAIALLLFSLMLTTLVCSCGGGFSVAFLQEKTLSGTPTVTELSLPYEAEAGLDLFMELNIANGDEVTLSVLPVAQGEIPHAVITYPKDFDSYGFSAQYENGTLSLSAEDKYRFACDVLDIALYADLRTCTLSGAMELEVLCGGSEMHALQLTVNGAAACEIEDIRCKTLDITCNGASAISVEGEADTFALTLNGAGDVEATELLTDVCEVTINGAGNAEVHAKTKLTAKIYGVGSVAYLGDPTVEKELGGAGTVHKLQDRDA